MNGGLTWIDQVDQVSQNGRRTMLSLKNELKVIKAVFIPNARTEEKRDKSRENDEDSPMAREIFFNYSIPGYITLAMPC